MGQIRKIGELYYIEFYARGLLYSQAAGHKKQAAQKMLEQIEAKIAHGEAMTVVREIDLSAFFEQFLAHAQKQFSAKSIERFVRTWKHWRAFLQDTYPHINTLSQITPSVVESYKTILVKKAVPPVVNLTILLLREILEYQE